MSDDSADPRDEDIAAAIQSKGLEIEYLRELAASLGFDSAEPWTEEAFAAIDAATPDQRRAAALRTLRFAS